MKTFRTVVLLVLCMGLLFSTTSCVVFVRKDNGRHKDNGKHKGWYKNSNIPHNPNSTNPGKSQESKKNNYQKC